MRKIILIPCYTLLSACVVHTNVHEIRPNEYGIPLEFDGRIYSINCYSNNAGVDRVKNKCLRKMATVANDKQYQYFTVLSQKHAENNQIIPITTTKQITTNASYSSNAYAYGSGGYANAYGSSAMSSTTSVPYTEYYNFTTYTSNFMFVLIDESDLDKWENYYRVSDYYKQ